MAASLTDVELDSILQCPVSRRRLRRMTGPELEEQNRIIGAGAATFLDGRPVSRTLSAGLVSDDGRYIYPDQEGLLFLMREWAIPAEDGDGDSIVALDDITKSVRDFYDDVGWERGEEGAFADADLFEDLRPVSARYIHDCHLRVLRYVDREGRFLLDAGSGPIQYPEYLAYSEGYCKRICVDISVTGLREAQRKLQDKGVYILADISNLPLASSSMDGVVSLHTIYHIPKERQEGAVREICRVLAPGRRAAIVYEWKDSSLNRVLLLPLLLKRFAGRILRRAGLRRGQHSQTGSSAHSGRTLFAEGQSYRWFIERPWGFEYEIAVWRSVSVPVLRLLRPRALVRSRDCSESCSCSRTGTHVSSRR